MAEVLFVNILPVSLKVKPLVKGLIEIQDRIKSLKQELKSFDEGTSGDHR